MIRTCLVATAMLVACKDTERWVARLEATSAVVERQSADKQPWQAAKAGDKLRLNSAVRTGEDSRARLRVGRRGVLELEANALVRFVSDPNQQQSDVRIEAGAVQIESGDEALNLGTATLSPGGKARVSAQHGGVKIDVEVGQVVLESGEAITAGQSITVQIGGAILEEVGHAPIPVDAAVAAVDAAPDAAPEAPEASAEGPRITVAGRPARYRGKTGWQLLAVGDHQLDEGTRINTPKGSTVTVSRAGARASVIGGSEIKLQGADNPALVALLDGAITLDAENGNGSVALVGGSVVLENGQVAAQMAKGRTEIVAHRGEAVVRSTTAEAALQEGDSVVLEPSGKITFSNRAPTSVTFSFPAGESPTIHDAAAPTPVRVRFGCPGRLDVAKDARFSRIFARAGGRTGGNALLPPGSYAYRVSCDGGKVIRGRVRVVKDSGRKPLPRAAPRTLVEPDGREYVISYQNLLPELTLVWRDAPARSGYTFVVEPSNGEQKRIKTAVPRVSLESGELPEGTYTFWVEIPETGGRSDKTRIVIDFDNAAATASIEKVARKDGGKLQVRGTAIEGTTVTAGNAPIALDRHQRFDTELAPAEGEDGVAIRIAHAKLGVHYYVLRSSK